MGSYEYRSYFITGLFIFRIYHALSVWYKVTDRTEIGAFISIFGALLTLIINIIFIPLIGYLASAIATLAAYTLMAIASYSLGQKYYTIPYNISKISIYLLISVLFSALSFYRFRGGIYYWLNTHIYINYYCIV